jgi:hypothetical protein
MLNRGRGWAMFEVGEYGFSPCKVVCEVYGKTHFNPTTLRGIGGRVNLQRFSFLLGQYLKPKEYKRLV